MSQILLYLDEDAMDEDLVQAIRSQNVDVVTAAEAEMLHRSDQDQLNWANTNSRVIYTHNIGDFYELHTAILQQNRSHRGIILSPQQRYGIGDQMRAIVNLIATLSAEEMLNQIEFLGDWIE